MLPATPSTRVVRLDLTGASFPFRAGQAALIGLAERDERVPYSIASAPAEALANRRLDFLIKVEPSGRWGHQFDGVAVGDRIGIRGPMGSFLFPSEAADERLLFIAGGTGIAPIRAMIRQALMTGRRGPMKLSYSAKTADDFAYLSELEDMARRAELELHLHVTREVPDASTSAGRRAGRIGMAEIAPLIDDPATLCFVCGPETMVAAVPRMLLDLGIDRGRIRVEEW